MSNELHQQVLDCEAEPFFEIIWTEMRVNF